MFKYNYEMTSILAAGLGSSIVTSFAVSNGQDLKVAILITIYATFIAILLDKIYS